jgi:hypothetical protein
VNLSGSYSTDINSINSLARKDFLSEGSKFTLDLKEVISKVTNDDIKSRLEGQIKLEELCLLNEEMFFNNLLLGLNDKDSSTNLLRLKLVNDWEYKLNNALMKYLQPYVINNYRKLFKEVDKVSDYAVFVLLILSFEGSNLNKSRFLFNKKEHLNKSNKIITLMLSIIMRLLAINDDLGGGEIKKINLIMSLSNNLISRAPKILAEELELNVLQDFYEQNVLNMAEETKASVGMSLLDLLLENVDILVESDSIYKDNKRYKIISIKNEYRESLLRRSMAPIMLPMIVEPLD